MAATFRLGLAGAGRMGRTHLRALAGSDVVAVTAIAEPSTSARAAAGAVAGTGGAGGAGGAAPPVYASVAEMLDRGALDGVLIAAPSDLHGQIIAEVAARSLPILCEKPCGVSSAQARASADAAAAAGVPLQVAYWRRYVPALRALRDRIAEGKLGGLHLVSCYQWDQAPPPAAFRASSGGIFIDMGVHEFDQLRWLTGQDIGDIQVAASSLIDDPAIRDDVDSAQLIARLSGGTIGLVSLGRHHPAGDMCRAEVFGTAGTERCDFLDPSDGERAQLAALRSQAEDFAAMAGEAANGGADGGGATAADAVAALEAAERANAAMAAQAVTA